MSSVEASQSMYPLLRLEADRKNSMGRGLMAHSLVRFEYNNHRRNRQTRNRMFEQGLPIAAETMYGDA